MLAIQLVWRRIRSICDPCSKQYMRLSRIFSGSKWKRFAWRIPEAQGSDLSGNLFGRKRRGHNACILAMRASAFLQMFVVVIDREPELG
jgi:hypothetical protein